jgi:hypothetical protein
MTAAQAVKRALFLSAMKGNAHAQRTYLQLVANAQAQQEKFKQDELTAAVALKMALDDERRRWVADGGDEMTMARHPSDIDIDANGEVKMYLAQTDDALTARDRLISFRDYTLELLARSDEVIAEDGDDTLLSMTRELAEHHVRTVNEQLPPRFRRWAPADTPAKMPPSPEALWEATARDLAARVVGRGEGPGLSDSLD